MDSLTGENEFSELDLGAFQNIPTSLANNPADECMKDNYTPGNALDAFNAYEGGDIFAASEYLDFRQPSTSQGLLNSTNPNLDEFLQAESHGNTKSHAGEEHSENLLSDDDDDWGFLENNFDASDFVREFEEQINREFDLNCGTDEPLPKKSSIQKITEKLASRNVIVKQVQEDAEWLKSRAPVLNSFMGYLEFLEKQLVENPYEFFAEDT